MHGRKGSTVERKTYVCTTHTVPGKTSSRAIRLGAGWPWPMAVSYRGIRNDPAFPPVVSRPVRHKVTTPLGRIDASQRDWRSGLGASHHTDGHCVLLFPCPDFLRCSRGYGAGRTAPDVVAERARWTLFRPSSTWKFEGHEVV